MAWTNKQIETERLVLRPARENDKTALTELLTNERVRQYLGGPVPQEALTQLTEATVGERWGSFVIAGRDDSCLGALRLHDDRGEWELSYEMLPQNWGRGLASEAGHAALSWAWSALVTNSIIAVTQQHNLPSVRLLRRLGFGLEREFVEFGEMQSQFRIGRHDYS